MSNDYWKCKSRPIVIIQSADRQDLFALRVWSECGRNLLLPWLEEFQLLHPGIQYRLHLSDRVTNVYSDLVDAAFRQCDPPDSSMLALPIDLTNRRVLCASPAYLEQHGTPDTPQALAEHVCLCFLLGEEVYDRWKFWRNGEELTVRVSGGNIANDGDAVRRWALAGRGITYKSRLDVAADLAAGRLVALCAEWKTEASPLYMVVPGRRQLTPGLRLLREFVGVRCGRRAETWQRPPTQRTAAPPR